MFALRTCANIVSFLLVTKNEIGAERGPASGRPLRNEAAMLRMAKAQDEHERHAVKHLGAAAGTAACAVNRRLHGRCFAAREPLSTLLQPA